MPMSLHTDEQFLAAVAAALGETIAFVRRRGFHLEHTSSDDGQRPVRSSVRRRANDDHAIDLSQYGIDWDATHDSRPYRRRRRLSARRTRRRAA
jgi:hypothetical protein